jgi:hypothetical protein
MNPRVEVIKARTIPMTHIRNSAQYPYLSAVNLCMSSWSTKPLPTATNATTKRKGKLSPANRLAPPVIPPLYAIVNASASAAHAMRMSLTSFWEKRIGLLRLPGDVPEYTELSQERVVAGLAATLRVRSPLHAWASGSLCSPQKVPPQ